MRCTCCDEYARKQCADHDFGYGVCDRCFEKYGREQFCMMPSCTAHDLTEGRTIWNSDGTDGPVLICLPPSKA
jgi:hypothetical protein